MSLESAGSNAAEVVYEGTLQRPYILHEEPKCVVFNYLVV